MFKMSPEHKKHNMYFISSSRIIIITEIFAFIYGV